MSNDGFKLRPALLAIGLALMIWFIIPVPEGVKPAAWHLLALFVGTIAAIIGKVMPIGALAMIAIALVALLGVTSDKPGTAIADALSGFANPLIWLIGLSIMISRGLIKTGGDRAKIEKNGIDLAKLVLCPVGQAGVGVRADRVDRFATGGAACRRCAWSGGGGARAGEGRPDATAGSAGVQGYEPLGSGADLRALRALGTIGGGEVHRLALGGTLVAKPLNPAGTVGKVETPCAFCQSRYGAAACSMVALE